MGEGEEDLLLKSTVVTWKGCTCPDPRWAMGPPGGAAGPAEGCGLRSDTATKGCISQDVRHKVHPPAPSAPDRRFWSVQGW